MKRLTKEKRQQIVLAILMVAMVLCGLWFGLIRFQRSALATAADSRDKAVLKLKTVKHTIETVDQLETNLAEARKRITALEETMASGDLYAWAINKMRTFKHPYKVEVPQFSQIDGPKKASLLPDFPYQEATLTIGGTALYNDFGRFIADFENEFPYMRVRNLTLEPAPGQQTAEKEKLSFRLDIAALVKPNV